MRIDRKINILGFKLKLKRIKFITTCKVNFKMWLLKTIFKMLNGPKKWFPDTYEAYIKDLYKDVRVKDALLLKEKIINPEKGNKHVKMFMVEQPNGDISYKFKFYKAEYPGMFYK